MAQNYLEKFRSTISSSQGRQIFRRLQEKQQLGEIKNIEALKQELKTLTTNLLEKQIKPILVVYQGIVGEDIHSEQYNEMLSRIQDDLETAFAESNNLYEILDVHSEIINRTALQLIERSLNQIEDEITALEFLQRGSRGYTTQMFNTFRDNKELPRNSEIKNVVYSDFRTGKYIPIDEHAHIDLIGEQLTLGAFNSQYVSPSGVENLKSSNATQSSIDADFVNNPITNLIDNKKHTYWGSPILTTSPFDNGAFIEIALKLPGVQSISFVEIDLGTPSTLNLYSLKYIDGSGVVSTISDTSITLDKETVRINFNEVKAQTILFLFQQENYKELQTTTKTLTQHVNYSYLVNKEQYVAPNINDDISNAIANDFIKSDILGVIDSTLSIIKLYEYIIVLDNLRCGLAAYDSRSIYVSPEKAVSYPIGTLGLRIDEKRPTDYFGAITYNTYSGPAQSTDENYKHYLASTEYWVTVEFLNENDQYVTRRSFPVLPTNTSRIYHERMIFNKVSSAAMVPNISSTIFYCAEDSTDIKVYRNGTELTYSTDWTFIADGDVSGTTEENPGSGLPMRRGIQITNRTNYIDIYTISYTPLFSNTKHYNTNSSSILRIIDLIGDLSVRLGPNGTIFLSPELMTNKKVAKSKIWLSIILRRNTSKTHVTPLIEEYLLGVGEVKELE